jgi:hypothetical protein
MRINISRVDVTRLHRPTVPAGTRLPTSLQHPHVSTVLVNGPDVTRLTG